MGACVCSGVAGVFVGVVVGVSLFIDRGGLPSVSEEEML
jgi:hypothetical protein